ncbi:hypothetical protein BGZ68_005171 [Mortierella alpina]|nr:hypothetical protein BGZ68_005171 [Mortierella alpina]
MLDRTQITPTNSSISAAALCIYGMKTSVLVNKSGRRQGWKPTDLYQEHCNRTLKHVYHNRRGDITFDMLRERISMNIETLDHCKARTEETFGAPINKRKHAAVSAETDISEILTVLSENDIVALQHVVPSMSPQ